MDGHVNYFGGTARFYDKYRPSYPEEVWDLVTREAPLTESSSVELEGEPGHYRLVVIASAFHWMDRPTVAARCHTALEPGGLLAVLGNPTPLTQIRQRETGVGAAIAAVQDRWFGNDQFPLDVDRLARPEDVLRASPFGAGTVLQVPSEQQWDVESFLGFLRSTSSRPDQRLGDRFPLFADEIRQAVESVVPSGRWSLRSTAEVVLARR